MQMVKFYTVNYKMVTAYGGYIPVYNYGPIVNCSNSSDIFLESEIKVDHLPVQRFCFTQGDGNIENRFVAFDRELEEIISILIDDEVRCIRNGYLDRIKSLTSSYDEQIKVLKSRTAWDIIRLNLVKWWNK